MRITTTTTARSSNAPGIFKYNRHTTQLRYSNDLPYAPPAASDSKASTSISVGRIEDTSGFKNTASVNDWRSHEDRSREHGWRGRLRERVSSASNGEFVKFLTFTSSSIVRYALQGLASITLARLAIDGRSPSDSSSYLSQVSLPLAAFPRRPSLAALPSPPFLATLPAACFVPLLTNAAPFATRFAQMQDGFSNRGLSLLGEAAHAALQEYEGENGLGGLFDDVNARMSRNSNPLTLTRRLSLR